MQPVVHLAVGYLCYAAYTRWSLGRQPADVPALVAVFAAGLADLIDKPLHAAGVVPVGRTIGHSLLFAIPLVLFVWLVASRRDRPILGVAFAIGYLSHIATDVPWHLISGDFDELGFLLWPITDMPAYTGVKPLGTVTGVEVTTLWLEAVILVAGIVLWWVDGRPGVGAIRRALGAR
ncbi:metal-dependent hydrolase [Natronorubrum sp. JWXQ-INN-674]|uniref:Metal-dependent hydrolase n=1 Tax=Natronorubrum halalkaliphilum TaxID=2691917 RepID=A0A6B0VQ62_9EURY|nr:metal-dependent hydrolase [Natronorubrum halalkaliphilum]MXV63971.1 metal-dependent hydrolase [Natronorubrum halalkaliphilum]